MDIRKITDELSVAPQIAASDIATIAAAGFRSVICNRPDGESAGQPCGGDIEAVVKAHGLVWRSQPVLSGAVTIADAQEFGALLAELPKPVLATTRISQGVSQGLLIKRVDPKFPPAALATHAAGKVEIEAKIDTQGYVKNLKVLKGDPMLAQAARTSPCGRPMRTRFPC